MLCPTKLGPTGTQALNVELQNLLNPEQKGKPQLQSAAGLAPQLGNADPMQETLTAGAARLEQANDEGSAVYTVTLTAHYTMKWSDTFED